MFTTATKKKGKRRRINEIEQLLLLFGANELYLYILLDRMLIPFVVDCFQALSFIVCIHYSSIHWLLDSCVLLVAPKITREHGVGKS